MSSTLCLIRQDPARNGLLRAILTSLAVGLLMRVVPDLGEEFTSLTADNLPGGFPYMYLVFTGLVATFVLGANAWTRSSRLALGLPVPARQAWAIRTGWLTAVALLSVATLTATLGISFDLEAQRLIVNPVVAVAAARSGATALLLLFLYQLPQSQRDRIPIAAPYVVYIICATLFTLLFSTAEITSIIGTLVLLTIAVALGIYLYRRVPPTFSVGPTVEESETPVWTPPDIPVADEEGSAAVGFPTVAKHPALQLHWALFRGVKWTLLIWFQLIIVGASTVIVILEFFKGTNAFLALVFVAIYALPLIQNTLEGLPPFDSLPISRWTLWAHGFGQIVAVIAIGTLFASAILSLNPLPFTQVRYEECCVKVPWEYFEISPDGRVPTITAAWGESFTPTAHAIWRGRATALYDPYETGPESSPRFIELQMRRAIETIYGVSIPAKLGLARYQAPPNVINGVNHGGFTLAATRGLSSADRNRSAAVAVFFLSVLFTILTLLIMLQYGPSSHRKVFKWSFRACIALFVAAAVAVSVVRLLGYTEIWYIGALASIGIRSVAHWLPLPTWILWLFCVTFWAATYLLLGRVFGMIEFPRERTMNRFAEEY